MSQASKKLGQQTVQFQNPPVILSTSSVVGPMEGQGPLGGTFDRVLEDVLLGEKSWENAEQKIMQLSVDLALEKIKLTYKDMDYFLAGDLMNQIVSANFTARQLSVPFLGLFGACSTMFEGMALAAMIIDGGFAKKVAVSTSSHHNTAERQYRYPTELGVQRLPSAQWTVTGAGTAILADSGEGPRVTHATVGQVVDMGVKDINDMGAAMAPAAAHTIVTHFRDTGRKPSDYDLILTGDLGKIGKAMAEELVRKQGYDLGGNYDDCGVLIFDPITQDTHAGGSGCACSAVVVGGHVLSQMRGGKYKRVFVVGTGALFNPITAQQGNSIPGIGHGVVIELMGSN